MTPIGPIPIPFHLADDVLDVGGDILGTPGGTEDQLLGQFQITAYGPPWNEMNGTGITSQGTDLRGKKGIGKYIVAVDPSVIPYGTRLKIDPNPFGDPSIVFTADDTGGAFQGGVRKIDVFDWRGRSSQMRWGSRNAKVYKTTESGGSGILGAVSGAADAASSTGDFIGDLVSTLLNFRKLGELLAKVTAWFLRLVLRAIWDYCIAPIFHWNERAVTYYYRTFFSYEGSKGRTGFDRAYRESAGIVTMIFWGLGYGILWTTPDSPLKPANSPRDSILGRSIRAVEGQVARRSLVKPKDVEAKTPPKPEPKESVARVEKTRDFHTARRRPVSVEGRRSTEHVSNQRRGQRAGETKIILPTGHSKPTAPKQSKAAAKQSGPRLDSQSSRSLATQDSREQHSSKGRR